MLELKLKKKKKREGKKKKNRIEPRLSRTMKFDNVLSIWSILLPLLLSSLQDLKKGKKKKK